MSTSHPIYAIGRDIYDTQTMRLSEKSSRPPKDKTMSDISNFARHNAVSVVEFADYLRECRPYNGPKRKQNEIHGGSGCLTVWW